MNPFLPMPMCAFTISFFMWTYVLARHRTNPAARVYLVLSGFLALWQITEHISWLPGMDRDILMAIARIQTVFWLTPSWLFLFFIYRLLGRRPDALLRITGTVVFLVCLVAMITDKVVAGIRYLPWGVSDVIGPFYYPAVFLCLVPSAILLFILLVKGLTRTGNPVMRNQLIILAAGLGITFFLAFPVGSFASYFMDVRVIPNSASTIMVIQSIFIFIAITRYRLMAPGIREAAGEIFSGISEGIVILDADGRIMAMNPAAWAIYSAGGPSLPAELLQDTVTEYHAEFTIPRGEDTGSLSVARYPLRQDGHHTGALIIVRDISEKTAAAELLRRHSENLESQVRERTAELTKANTMLQDEIIIRERMEEERLRYQKMESLSVLAGGIAHDFNNFLGAIVGNLDLAVMDRNNPDLMIESVTQAREAALRARTLTHQLLTFSRGGAPVMSPHLIASLVGDTAAFCMRGSRSTLNFDMDGTCACSVDYGQLSQVIQNLVINADQSMNGGGTIHITVSSRPVDASDPLSSILKPGSYVVIGISDTGTGIPPENLARIFDPYFSTKNSSGLGLAVVHSIISRHGGHITVDSREGEGTHFRIYLPSYNDDIPVNACTAGIHSGSGRILYLDDDPALCTMVTGFGKRLGYQVETANDGERALNMYLEAMNGGHPYRAVIMDLTIPGGMGGETLNGLLKQHDPGAVTIIASGYADSPVMARYCEEGFRGMMIKPFTIQDFSRVVAAALNDPSVC